MWRYNLSLHFYSAREMMLLLPSLLLCLLSVQFTCTAAFKNSLLGKGCVPLLRNGQLSDDHAAHAVPGSYLPHGPAYIDIDGDGLYRVSLDASEKHTHYLNLSRGIVGRLTSAVWRHLPSNRIISRQLKFSRNFPVGTTHLSLTITDSAHNTHQAVTTVRVAPRFRTGAYCYFYKYRVTLPKGNIATSSPRPSYASVFRSLRITTSSVPFRNRRYAAHCTFYWTQPATGQSVQITAPTAGSGFARVIRAGKTILDTRMKSQSRTYLPKGRTAFEVQYVFTSTLQSPSFTFLVNGQPPVPTRISHDTGSIVPVLSAVLPGEGKLSGGGSIKLSGYGLYPPLTVVFGGRRIKPISVNSDLGEIVVRAPPKKKAGIVSVLVTSSMGIPSNPLKFRYSTIGCDGPAFRATQLTARRNQQDEDVNFLRQPTSVALGPDHRLYVGTLVGTVSVLGYNALTLRLTTFCSSKPIRDKNFRTKSGAPSERSVLGITFNPTDTTTRPYVSTSTTNWWSNDRIARSNRGAWRNGAIDRLRLSAAPGNFPVSRGIGGICLSYDKRIVTGLPVANGGGHSVNALQFTRYGDLLIAVGGTTNMGLPGVRLGNIWESPLSGALLIAKLSRGKAFNGNIRYANDAWPHLAKKVGGDVSVFASGMRNMFTFTMTIRGQLYGIDQGPGCPLGGPAVACNDFRPALASSWDVDGKRDWPSRVRGSGPSCPGIDREDELLHLTRGNFYGHPNIQRGVSEECAWVDPHTGRTADGKRPPSNYKGPMTMIPASATGIQEYGASHFCGSLRGDLIISTFRGLTTWRVQVRGGKLISGPDVLAITGGTSFVEDRHGNLIFPRLTKRSVDVLQPIVKPASSLKVVGVWPHRHRRMGGSILFIGGYRFSLNSKVRIGRSSCTVIKGSVSSRQLSCRMPGRVAVGADLADVILIDGAQRSSLSGAVAFELK